MNSAYLTILANAITSDPLKAREIIELAYDLGEANGKLIAVEKAQQVVKKVFEAVESKHNGRPGE